MKHSKAINEPRFHMEYVVIIYIKYIIQKYPFDLKSEGSKLRPSLQTEWMSGTILQLNSVCTLLHKYG